MVLSVQSRPHTMHAAISGMGGAVLAKNGLTLVIDEVGLFINHRSLEATGVDAWVRLFKNGSEVPVDPHRIFINPPLVHNRIFEPRAAFESILWDSVLRVPNPKGWRTRGTVTTVFSTAADGFVASSDATYSTARSATGGGDDFSADTAGLTFEVENSDGYTIKEAFVSFDTSSIPDGDAVSAASLDLWIASDADIDRAYSVQARPFDWGASLTTADWRGGAAFAALTLLASLSSAGFTTGAYNSFAENGSNFQSAVSKTGTTYIVLGNSNYAANSAPTGNEWVEFMSADNTGTTNDPKLVVTHASAGSASPLVHGGALTQGRLIRGGLLA